MKRRELTRSEATRLQRGQESLAEELAAEEYGYDTFRTSEWDGARESGAIMEVKSTVSRVESGQKGRFWLFREQHESLRRIDNGGSGRYVFVLFDVSSRTPTAKMKMKQPAEIGHMIAGLGGFNESGHSRGEQIGIPYAEVFG
jgi:hypothetical protein